MKKYLLLTSLGMITTLFSHTYAQSFQEKYFKETSYIFDDLEKIRLPELFTVYKSEFKLGTDDEMVPTNNVVGQEGKFTTKYELYHKGIPVEGSMMNVIGDKGIVQYVNGFVRTGLNINVNNIISEQQAINIAIQFVGATKYPWQDDALREELVIEGDDPDETLFPQHAELMITKKRGENYDHDPSNYELCYKVIITALEPATVTNVFVSANTGAIFTSENGLMDDYTAIGNVWTWYNGLHSNIKTRSCGACSNYWLHDMDRNIFTTKYGVNPWNKGNYNKDNNNQWAQYTSESNIRTAASGHWALERAWEYYINRHGRWGTNYGGNRIHVQTDRSGMGANAAYNYVNNNDNIYIRPDDGHSAAMLDVLGHEYTHGMVRASSNLGVLGDFHARSMNEAYADIFGMRLEGYTLGSHDWTFAENMGTYQRNFANPHADFPLPSPAIYMEPGYWSPTAYHNNGGVLRKWFHLLSNGGTFNGNTVLPLGIETSDDIAYITFNWWLWSNLQYPEMASQTVHATVAHWGKCSKEHKQVVKALRAVGFNIQNPFCFKIGVEGPVVLDPAPGHVFEWKATLNDITDPNGYYEWEIPAGWHASVQGGHLILNSHQDNSSQKLTVNYTTPDQQRYSSTIVVHFSDVAWQPTNNMPQQSIGGHLEFKKEQSNGLTVHPNPASQKAQISFAVFEGSGTIELFDINGRLIQTHNCPQPQFELNVSGLSNGIYIIKAKTGDKTFSQKLSVIH
ncbi:MAG: T9SS type A sorting domain-containing protein [Sphingobacteriales bacterium]|nr:MAG: T9SS type A sorting domain-containing protein [Sphingobacteriales bacterium]